MFYANLHYSGKSDDLETLVLEVRIVINSQLFRDTLGCNFFGYIPYMNGNWPDNFKVSLDEAKAFISEETPDFGPLYLCFEHHILEHIVATTLIPRKRSLNSICNRDVFVLYCLLNCY